jgi:hypothetical protein
MIRIELDSVRKYRNAQEWRNVNRASALGMEEVGDHDVIKVLCRRITEAGHTGDVEVWRGELPCFKAAPLAVWASGKALKGEQPEHLRRAAE